MSRADVTTEARARYDEAAAAFDAAASFSGATERDFRLAGRPLRLRIAGEAMERLMTPALEHLECERVTEPEFTVSVWDSGSSGTAAPPLPRRRRPGEPTVRLLYRDGRFRAFAQPDERVLNVFDGEGAAMFWAEDAATLPYWESAAPLRVILNWWLEPLGTQLVHAGAIGSDAGGVLLAGPGGSGKSTTALACLGAGLSFAADDYVLVEAHPSRAHSLYGTAKLAALERFSGLASATWNGKGADGEKNVVLVRRYAPASMSPGFPLRALLAPRVVDRAVSSVRPIAPGAALRALAPSTLLQLPGSGTGALATMTALAATLPSYELTLGADLDGVASCVRGLVEELNA